MFSFLKKRRANVPKKFNLVVLPRLRNTEYFF
jgi:hypothetical protein